MANKPKSKSKKSKSATSIRSKKSTKSAKSAASKKSRKSARSAASIRSKKSSKKQTKNGSKSLKSRQNMFKSSHDWCVITKYLPYIIKLSSLWSHNWIWFVVSKFNQTKWTKSKNIRCFDLINFAWNLPMLKLQKPGKTGKACETKYNKITNHVSHV